MIVVFLFLSVMGYASGALFPFYNHPGRRAFEQRRFHHETHNPYSRYFPRHEPTYGTNGQFSSRIYDGFPALDDDIKDRTVKLDISFQNPSFDHVCTGSIIDANHILTAGHCIWQQNRGASEVLIYVNRGGPFLGLIAFVHKQFTEGPAGPTAAAGDIAIIRTELAIGNRFFPLSNNAANLGGQGTEYTVAGWGLVDATTMATQLQIGQFEREINDRTKCPQADQDAGSICADSGTSYSVTCQGDSGGPIYIDGTTPNDPFLLVGSTSHNINPGQAPCGPGTTSTTLFVDVSRFYTVITQCMNYQCPGTTWQSVPLDH